MNDGIRFEAEGLLSRLMLLRLQAWQSGEARLAEICQRAEESLRSWLEARR